MGPGREHELRLLLGGARRVKGHRGGRPQGRLDRRDVASGGSGLADLEEHPLRGGVANGELELEALTGPLGSGGLEEAVEGQRGPLLAPGLEVDAGPTARLVTRLLHPEPAERVVRLGGLPLALGFARGLGVVAAEPEEAEEQPTAHHRAKRNETLPCPWSATPVLPRSSMLPSSSSGPPSSPLSASASQSK